MNRNEKDELPHEKLIRDAKAAEEEAPEKDGETEEGYRVTRSEETETEVFLVVDGNGAGFYRKTYFVLSGGRRNW